MHECVYACIHPCVHAFTRARTRARTNACAHERVRARGRRRDEVQDTSRARIHRRARTMALVTTTPIARARARPRTRRRAPRARARETEDATRGTNEYSNETKLRSEAQAPFRVARQFLYGGLCASATIGLGIATIQGVSGAMGAPNAPPMEASLENVAVDGVALAAFGTLYRREDDARARQMARIGREERLGRLRCELGGNGKTVRLEQLRGFSRVVVVSGDAEYVNDAIADAEAVREALMERGVLIVPVLNGASADGEVAPVGEEDRKFRATPLRANEWLEWIREQKSMAKVGDDVGVYVGLRMDGRVRSSGTGRVPFARFAQELPPTDGWGGALDGFDGRVGVDT